MDRSAAKSIKAETASMERSAVGYLNAESASLKYTVSAVTYARGQANLKWASSSLLAARGDVNVRNGAAQIVGAADSVTIRNGAAAAVLTRNARVESGIVGLLVAGQADLDEKARVLFRPSGAAALGAGFAGGLMLAFAFLWRLFAAGRTGRRQ